MITVYIKGQSEPYAYLVKNPNGPGYYYTDRRGLYSSGDDTIAAYHAKVGEHYSHVSGKGNYWTSLHIVSCVMNTDAWRISLDQEVASA